MGRKGSRLGGVGLTTKVKRLGDRARNWGEQSRTHTSTRASWARTVLASPISQTILWGTRGLRGLQQPAGRQGLPTLSRGTHCSALMYSLSTGLHSTLPTRTPSRTSSKRRPRFSPMIVSLVPPCRGPVSGDSCGETEGGRPARAMRSCTGRQLGSQRPHSPWWPKRCTYLEDLGVGATAAAMVGMHPGSRQVSRAVRTQGTAALSHAPAALEARVSFEAEATALPQGRAFVEVGCRGKQSAGPTHGPTPSAIPPGSPWMF